MIFSRYFCLTVLLLEPCFLLVNYVESLAKVFKNCRLTINQFAYLGFYWYWLSESELQDYSMIFFLTNGYSITFSSAWLGKNYTINLNNLISSV